MYQRSIANELLNMARQYPVVTVIGPRQSGKTTLVKQSFSDKPYVSLEEPDTRAFAINDPRAFLARFPKGAVLDEIQRAPDLLSYIQSIVDEHNIKGEFILTGSHQLALHAAITQSLAGRTALLTLLPLSLAELQASNISLTLDEWIFTGFFPRIYHQQLEPTKAYRQYLQTYVERDVRQLIQLKDILLFQQFVKLCAGRIGRELNYQSLSNDLGVSSHTIKHWISILEASFVIFLLPPYFENLGKRIIKSPKLYFTDTGLATYLLDIDSPQQIQRDPLRGFLVENLVVLEMLKYRYNHGKEAGLYHYRDSQQREIDIVFKRGSQLIPIEIKAAQTFNVQFFQGLKYFNELTQERCPQGYLIYSGTQEQTIDKWHVLNYQHIEKIFTG